MEFKDKDKCYDEYKKIYKHPHVCGFLEPSDDFSVSNEDTEKTYIMPENETLEAFLDRIERSKKAGKNLFYEEWEEFHYKEGVLY